MLRNKKVTLAKKEKRDKKKSYLFNHYKHHVILFHPVQFHTTN